MLRLRPRQSRRRQDPHARRRRACVEGSVRFTDHHEGAPGFAHGGAVSTALDDSIGFVLVLDYTPAVTVHLEIDFRAPVPLNRELTLASWREHSEGRKLRMAASLHGGESLLAEAHALYLRVEFEHFTPEALDTWTEEHGS